jgi:ribulose-phosphate 3-epimerase
MLAADFGNLESEARRCQEAGADGMHLDVMDGHFVPNLAIGTAIIATFRDRLPSLYRHVHLMINNPHEHVGTFADAGAQSLLIHVEPEYDIESAISDIRSRGIRRGLVISPGTDPDRVFPYLETIDEVLCMTVVPGFGGQDFIPEALTSMRRVRDRATDAGLDLDISVDGGITIDTARQCAEHGANVFASGTFLLKSDDMADRIREMRDAVESV